MLGLYWGNIVVLGLCWGNINVLLGLYWGYMGIMEKKMETTAVSPPLQRALRLRCSMRAASISARTPNSPRCLANKTKGNLKKLKLRLS